MWIYIIICIIIYESLKYQVAFGEKDKFVRAFFLKVTTHQSENFVYGVATVSRLLQNIGLFCRI